MKTFNQDVKHKKEWYLVDAENKTLGTFGNDYC